MTASALDSAQALVRSAKFAALSTLAATGHPFGSLVAYVLVGPTPVLLLSDVAEHAKNLYGDARASLLVAPEPSLARDRVTLHRGCTRRGRGRVCRRASRREPLSCVGRFSFLAPRGRVGALCRRLRPHGLDRCCRLGARVSSTGPQSTRKSMSRRASAWGAWRCIMWPAFSRTARCAWGRKASRRSSSSGGSARGD